MDHRQGRRQRDKTRAGDTRRALRGQQHDCQHGHDLCQAQVDVAGLGNEHGGQREVDRRAVEVERVAR